MTKQFSTRNLPAWVLANVFILGAIAYAQLIESGSPDFYYLSVQEDEYLEWSTFWAFLLAGIVYMRNGVLHRQATSRLPWFLSGIALFCVVVAMEEISWGQRQIGYRPPTYFLENNYQQELNFHNTIGSGLRRFALAAVIAGYGVLLPIASQVASVRNWFANTGIYAPSIGLLPAFAAMFVLYELYPWSHSGEWVEFMLGLGFMFAALLTHARIRRERRAPSRRYWTSLPILAGGFSAAVGLGLVSAALSRANTAASVESLQAASVEVAALAQDFKQGRATTRCNLHKRLYTFVQEYRQAGLYQGSFAGLQSGGLPAERGEYFLDPWNSPYWIRDHCDRVGNRRIVFVYSFGPDRKRDSTSTEIRGDDVGVLISAR